MLIRAEPMRVEETIGIARPPETVWAVVADPHNDPRWCRTVKSVDLLGRASLARNAQANPAAAPTGARVEALEG